MNITYICLLGLCLLLSVSCGGSVETHDGTSPNQIQDNPSCALRLSRVDKQGGDYHQPLGRDMVLIGTFDVANVSRGRAIRIKAIPVPIEHTATVGLTNLKLMTLEKSPKGGAPAYSQFGETLALKTPIDGSALYTFTDQKGIALPEDVAKTFFLFSDVMSATDSTLISLSFRPAFTDCTSLACQITTDSSDEKTCFGSEDGTGLTGPQTILMRSVLSAALCQPSPSNQGMPSARQTIGTFELSSKTALHGPRITVASAAVQINVAGKANVEGQKAYISFQTEPSDEWQTVCETKVVEDWIGCTSWQSDAQDWPQVSNGQGVRLRVELDTSDTAKGTLRSELGQIGWYDENSSFITYITGNLPVAAETLEY